MTHASVLREQLVDPSPATDSFVYKYTDADGVKKTLAGQRIKLGAFSLMNDPRERSRWFDDTIPEAVDRLLRQGTCMVSFTAEASPESEDELGTLFHRGWARARMWATYGDNHKGACLVFDRDELVKQVDAIFQHPAKDGGLLNTGNLMYCDSVKYENRKMRSAHFPVGVTYADWPDILDDPRYDEIFQDIYMTKNKDWLTEHEFRIVIRRWHLPDFELNKPILLPYGRALRGLIIGDRFVESDYAKSVSNSSSLPLLKCVWSMGAPNLTEDI